MVLLIYLTIQKNEIIRVKHWLLLVYINILLVKILNQLQLQKKMAMYAFLYITFILIQLIKNNL